MANCINYNCDELPPYESTIANCGAKGRNSGASTMWLLECGATISDPGNQAEIDALVLAGLATELENLKIGFAAPSPITQDSITSCGTPITINYTRTMSIEDAKVTTGNTEFWSTAKKRTYGGVILKECSTTGLDEVTTFIDAEVSIESYRDFPNTQDQLQKYIVTGSWKSYDDPLQYPYTP